MFPIIYYPPNYCCLFHISLLYVEGCIRLKSVPWEATDWLRWVRGGNHTGEANKPRPPSKTTAATVTAMPRLPSWISSPTFAVSHTQLRVRAALTTPCQVSMATPFLWKLSSQKLGFFLVSFGFIWGMMLLHFTIQQRASHENSAVLRQQILDLSKRYIKALAEENQSVMDGPYVGTMTAYGEYPPL